MKTMMGMLGKTPKINVAKVLLKHNIKNNVFVGN
jgi:hypothetical protein